MCLSSTSTAAGLLKERSPLPPGLVTGFWLRPEVAWQLHTHPDLIGRLRDLAPGWPVTAAYGVAILAGEGIAAVVALGTDYLVSSRGQPVWI
jgi:hypothetical protein